MQDNLTNLVFNFFNSYTRLQAETKEFYTTNVKTIFQSTKFFFTFVK